MSLNYQEERLHTRHPGLKPAGRVIDFRKERREKNSTQTPQETVQISCGLCRFQFDRIVKPTQLVLVCPSCGVRFEHHLPEPPVESPKNRDESLFATPPKRLKTTLHQPLLQSRRQNLQAEVPVEETPEMELSQFPVASSEPFDAETEYELISQAFAPRVSVEEPDFDKDVQHSWELSASETQQETQWIASLITIAQSILIVAALVALLGGLSSYFHENPKPVAKIPPEIPKVPYKKPESAVIREPASVITNTKPQTSPEPVKTAAKESLEAGQSDLPLFDISDLPVLQVQQVPQQPLKTEELQTTTASSMVSEEEARTESTEIDAEPKVQLQAKLAETEKKVQTLLQEQWQIQTQSKKLVSETLLRESAITLERNPTRSLFLSLKSIQILQELGLQVSDWGKTILAQAYAAQSAGEWFIKQVPTIEAQSVSSNGKWLLTSHSGRALCVWDLSKTGGEKPEEAGFQIDVSSVPIVDLLLTPDEHWLVGARADGLGEVWNMTMDWPSEAKMTLRDHIPGLRHVQISPDGRWLVAYGQVNEDRTQRGQMVNPVDWNGVWIWDMNLLKQGNVPRAIILRGHEGPIRCLAISADSRWLATGSEDRSARVFDLKSAYPGGNQKVLLGHQLEITDLQFAPNGQWIATGSRDSTVRIWNLQSETATPTARILKGHNGWVSSLAVSTDGKWLATAGYDQSVQLWNTQSILSGIPEKESVTIVPGQGTIQKVAFTPDSGSLITYGANRSLKIWDFTTESITDHTVEISRNISRFAFGVDGRWLILSNNQGTHTSVSLWPLQFEDMVQQATRFKETALPTELHQREDAYAKQFEQRMIR